MREVTREGVRWRVYETNSEHVPGARAAHCLLFDSEGIVRRVWVYPGSWRELSDDELWALLEAASGQRPQPIIETATQIPVTRSADLPAVAAATANAARARSLLRELTCMLESNRALRDEQRDLLKDCERIRGQMRSTVESYANTLRLEGIPPERALVLLKTAMEEGLGGPQARDEPGADELLRDGVSWGISAYYAA
jgi:hypothetical protein